VTSAEFLKEEPKSKNPEKRATWIIVRAPKAEATKFKHRFLFLGKYKEARIMWHATLTTQCTRCWQYKHPRVGCQKMSDLCPFSALKQRESDNRCGQTVCRGYKKLIPGCCNMTPAKCPACGGNHSARDNECPE